MTLDKDIVIKNFGKYVTNTYFTERETQPEVIEYFTDEEMADKAKSFKKFEQSLNQGYTNYIFQRKAEKEGWDKKGNWDREVAIGYDTDSFDKLNPLLIPQEWKDIEIKGYLSKPENNPNQKVKKHIPREFKYIHNGTTFNLSDYLDKNYNYKTERQQAFDIIVAKFNSLWADACKVDDKCAQYLDVKNVAFIRKNVNITGNELPFKTAAAEYYGQYCRNQEVAINDRYKETLSKDKSCFRHTKISLAASLVMAAGIMLACTMGPLPLYCLALLIIPLIIAYKAYEKYDERKTLEHSASKVKETAIDGIRKDAKEFAESLGIKDFSYDKSNVQQGKVVESRATETDKQNSI